MSRSIQKKAIDEVPSGDHPHSVEDSAEVGKEQPTGTISDPADTSRDQERVRRGIRRKKYCLACSVLLVLSAIAAFSFFKFPALSRQSTKGTVASGPTLIRRAITLPRYSQKHRFLILVGSGQKKDLLELSVECEFYGTGEKKDLPERTTMFRDAIYQFLKSRQPADNSQASWLKIVEKDLLEHLRARFVEDRPNSIRLWRYIRL